MCHGKHMQGSEKQKNKLNNKIFQESYLKKKRLQIQIRRFLFTKSPCKELSKYIGIDKLGFKKYIESHLIDGMNLDNYKIVWDIDHVVPVEIFNLEHEADLLVCYNYQNLTPMFVLDNKFKGTSIHFSLEFLKQKEKTNIVNSLIEFCEKEIENRWKKYLNKK